MRKIFVTILLFLGSYQTVCIATPPPPPIEPMTAIAIAQFSISMLRSFSGGGGNQLDAVVKLLTAMNEKLNIMNKKLDVILDEVVKSPDKTVYKFQFEDAKSAISRLNEYYAHYQRDAVEKSPKEAKAEFNRKYKSFFREELERIKKATFLLEHDDPVTVSFVCLLTTTYYEYSRFIDRDPEDLSYEMRPFFRYLTKVAWNGNNSLIRKIEYYRSEQAGFFGVDYKCMEVTNHHVGGGKEGDNDSWTEVHYYQTQKAYTPEPITDQNEMIALRYSKINGLYTEHAKGTFNYKLVKILKNNIESFQRVTKSYVLKS